MQRFPFTLAILTFAAATRAQTPATPPQPPASAWETTTAVRTSLGWRDNILLSPFAPIGRAFGRGEVEAFLSHPLGARGEFISFLNGDVLRYFSPPPDTGGEQQWFAHGEVRWQPVAAARLTLKADAFFEDMVIDLSETEAARIVAPTRVQGAFATAAPRLVLPAGFALEPAVQVKRTDYRDFAGDHDETRAGARLEWKRSDALALSAAWFERRRRYADRPQFTASGRALAGTHLRFTQREGELRAATAWNAGGTWTATATAGRMENRDGASGYFDHDQKHARIELAWERDRWRATLDADAKRVDYRVQTVGAGLAPPPRIADEFETTVRLERTLNTAWLLFAEHRWERSRSNETEFSYRANTVLAGVQRSF